MNSDSTSGTVPSRGQLREKLEALEQAVHRSWMGMVVALVATTALWLGGGAVLRSAGASEFWAMVVAGVVVSAVAAWATGPYAKGCGYNVPLWTALAVISPWFPFALPLGFVVVQIDLARHLRNYGVPYRLWRLDKVQLDQAKSRLKA